MVWIRFRRRGAFLIASVVPAAAAGLLYDRFDCSNQSKWDYNWDKREPESMITWADQQKIQNIADLNDKLDKLKSKAKRNIILVRHGQYNLQGTKHDEERTLTELGRKQALETGKRLRDLNFKCELIVSSTMQRAMETTSFILDSVRVKHVHDSLLEEGFPCMPEPARASFAHREAQILKSGSRIEAAFRRHFWRAPPEQTEDSYDILVCHGNVIRYFVCRALQFPADGWLRMSVPHASITWLTIYPDGKVSMKCLGDSGHMAPDMVTFE